QAAGISYPRGLDRYHNIIPGADDRTATRVLEIIFQLELDNALGCDFASPICVWRGAVAIVVSGTEKYGDGIAALLKTHLEYGLSVEEFLVGVLAGKVWRFRSRDA